MAAGAGQRNYTRAGYSTGECSTYGISYSITVVKGA